MDVIV